MRIEKYILGFFLSLVLLASCEEETYEFGELIAPTDMVVDYTIQGSEDNPLGDGSGIVNFEVSAKNALSYRFVYKDQEYVTPDGKKAIAFSSEDGEEGPNGGSLYNVTAVVYGVGGASSSKNIAVEVKGFELPPLIVEDFEGAEPSFITFGPDNHPIAVVDNPFINGINESSKVVEYAKPVGSEGWAGINVPVSGIDLDTYDKFSIKVYSTKENIEMVLKVETAAGNVDPKYEITGRIDKKEEWIEVFFDFSEAPEGDYTNVILFFDTWNSGDGSMYYFDDIKLSK